MKQTSWKIAVVCCVAVSLSSIGLLDRGIGVGTAPAVGGEPPHGGGGKGHAGGGGGAPHVAPGGGNVPAVGGNQPNISRPPAATRPNVGGQPGSVAPQPPAVRPGPGVGAPGIQPGSAIKPGVAQPGTAIKPGVAQPGTAIKPGVAQPGAAIKPSTGLPGSVGQPGSIVGLGSRGSVGATAGTSLSGSNRPGIVNQALGGNTVNLGQRSFNIAPSNYQPTHANYSWYRGYWGGFYGPSFGYSGFYGPGYGWGYGPGYGYGFGGGYAGFGYRPLGWGWGNWGLGALIYNSGYLGYWNPYYNGIGSFGGYNYAQPIPVVYHNTATATVSSCSEMLDSAIAAFKQNDYDSALDMANKGIAQCPNDAVLHEFRALVLFARSDYQQAAATIHSVLAVGPGWDWATVSSLYGSVATYTNQLRALESFTKENPDDAASRFLLAYHYMTNGHPDAAARHLQQVVKLMPNDRVAADVLKMVSAKPSGQSAEQPPTPQPPAEPKPADKSVDPKMLMGTWKATRDDGSDFELTLTGDATFTWKFSQKEHKEAAQEFGGKYKLDGNVLALERKEGGSLIAVVTPDGESKFNFKMLGAPREDPGLDFRH